VQRIAGSMHAIASRVHAQTRAVHAHASSAHARDGTLHAQTTLMRVQSERCARRSELGALDHELFARIIRRRQGRVPHTSALFGPAARRFDELGANFERHGVRLRRPSPS
jgi:hypothetical protein